MIRFSLLRDELKLYRKHRERYEPLLRMSTVYDCERHWLTFEPKNDVSVLEKATQEVASRQKSRQESKNTSKSQRKRWPPTILFW